MGLHLEVYLVETGEEGDARLEARGVKDSLAAAKEFAERLGCHNGLITRMIVGDEYTDGIGKCDHWHYDADSKTWLG